MRSKPEVKSEKSKNPDNEASKMPEKITRWPLSLLDSTGPTTEDTNNHYLIRVNIYKQGGARLSRNTRRQGRLTLPPISEETDKDKRYGNLLAAVPTEANPQPDCPQQK